MSDADCGACCAQCCGIFALCSFAACAPFMNTVTCGANGCCNSNTTAGCCNSCFSSKFNEDNFEAELQRDMEKTRDPNAPIQQGQGFQNVQPGATGGMMAERPSS
ncbi:hypothetical protein CC1G_15529 [Coprinopsis cinerea okayama7|uniref:Uncharacterized protein n=1 Tax=Coprinopsis cinerea (strain Okayama-7 / 130 / ATCC MYA-4618 / FGSC 9003) TaxID=240176 RepID=D6RN17_COPC7|nr:hypothetical protein CC1G_15529 [Coprinopsis cinerea okayama7\|eukprot:XP_002910988.1 hypothetical protein CC1G_15529 [Coprinopsis cinerea okayama7\